MVLHKSCIVQFHAKSYKFLALSSGEFHVVVLSSWPRLCYGFNYQQGEHFLNFISNSNLTFLCSYVSDGYNRSLQGQPQSSPHGEMKTYRHSRLCSDTSDPWLGFVLMRNHTICGKKLWMAMIQMLNVVIMIVPLGANYRQDGLGCWWKEYLKASPTQSYHTSFICIICRNGKKSECIES